MRKKLNGNYKNTGVNLTYFQYPSSEFFKPETRENTNLYNINDCSKVPK